MRARLLKVGAVAVCFGAACLALGLYAMPSMALTGSASVQRIVDEKPSDKRAAAVQAKLEATKPAWLREDVAKLDTLYAQLHAAPSAEKAAGVSKSIEAHWLHQGGSAAVLLADRALVFARKGEMDKAITLMDQVVLVQPSFAEGWRRRAQFQMQRSSPARAMLDLRETLRYEPRHYQAWVALGAMLESNEDPHRALAAYRRALGIYPLLPGLKDKVDTLAVKVRSYSL